MIKHTQGVEIKGTKRFEVYGVRYKVKKELLYNQLRLFRAEN